jgi:alpha-tubulin suppressor-like RCC1 family protein
VKSLFTKFINLALTLTIGALLLSACGASVTEQAVLPSGGTVTVVVSPARVVAGQIYTYQATSTSGTTVTWSWGDGSPDSVGSTVQKVWNRPGNQTVTLSATDVSSKAAVTQSVVVAGEPVSAGSDHTCALQPDGKVMCWGNNTYGQLGDGTSLPKTTTGIVTGLTDAVALSAGGIHTCALRAVGTVVCWGNSSNGQAGDGTGGSDKLSPVTVSGLTDAVALSAGRIHTCALKASGSVVCWGFNSNGQLGDGTTGNGSSANLRLTPVAVIGLTDATAISAGEYHSCALKTGGSVVCWGSNSSGQLGDGTSGNDKTATVAVTGLTDAVALNAGNEHTCALKTNGSVVCWGRNSTGALGDGTTTTKVITTAVAGLTDAVGISAGGGITNTRAGNVYTGRTCALKANGSTVCWGNNSSGELGDGSTIGKTTPVAVTGLTDTVAISAGAGHTCAIKASGAVACWGNNSQSQLGDGNFGLIKTNLVAVPGLTDTVSMNAGGLFSCALQRGGTVSCSGSNFQGQLGDGTTTTRTITAAVTGLTDAKTLTTGFYHACVIQASGTVACWGDNADGQLGDGTSRNIKTSTTVVSGLADAVALSANRAHTCALRANGNVACWGFNAYGEIGDGTTVTRTVSTAVLGLTDAVAIRAGGYHTCAVRSGGSVVCWGWNVNGQLGDGTTVAKANAVAVTGLTDAVSVSASDNHTCAIKKGGGVACWGWNVLGQLGDGTTTTRAIPTAVTNLKDVVAIGTSSFHSCALKANGSVTCWGGNSYGNLGDGTTTTRTTSTAVLGLTDAVSLSVGGHHNCALKTDNSVVCWGLNNSGQLGGSTTIDISNIPLPTPVLGGSVYWK